jgi:hypothetical protein
MTTAETLHDKLKNVESGTSGPYSRERCESLETSAACCCNFSKHWKQGFRIATSQAEAGLLRTA